MTIVWVKRNGKGKRQFIVIIKFANFEDFVHCFSEHACIGAHINSDQTPRYGLLAHRNCMYIQLYLAFGLDFTNL